MRRPALTWKAIKNLEQLVGFAQGEIDTIENNNAFSWSGETKPAREAIEWIKKCRQWKQEKEATNENLDYGGTLR